MTKKHLLGGTLHVVIVEEVLRAMAGNSGHIDAAAVEMGITPRTLRVWLKNWPELQTVSGAMEHIMAVSPKLKKSKKKVLKKQPNKAARVDASN